jgi:Protein of unknown function (DUF2934)
MSKHNNNKDRKIRQSTAAVELHQQQTNAASPAVSGAQGPIGASLREGQRRFNVTPFRTTSIPEHTQQTIRRRAYELYEQRGRKDGHAMEDWLRAESEVLGTMFRGKTG